MAGSKSCAVCIGFAIERCFGMRNGSQSASCSELHKEVCDTGTVVGTGGGTGTSKGSDVAKSKICTEY